MTSNIWPLVELAARPLDRDEREAVLGDSLEAGENAWQAFKGVLGFVLRRQVLLFKSWRPWLAAFGFALPCSTLLAYVSISVTCTSERLLGLKLMQWAPTGHEGFALLLCHIFLLITWAWTSGFAVGSISPRTLWWSIAVAFLVVVRFQLNGHGESFPLFYSLLFVVPAVRGARDGMRAVRLRLDYALLLAASMTTLTASAWFNHALWTPNWLLICPAFYLVATARMPAKASV